jgi:hypothetical protein
MAKELPFFKFNPTEWLVGKISYQSLEIQGAFVQCCAIFWKNSGVVKTDQIDWKIGKGNLESLVNYDFISIDKDGFLSIEFLEEQLVSFDGIRQERSISGQKSAEKRAEAKKATFVEENKVLVNENSTNVENNSTTYQQNPTDIRLKTKDLRHILNNSLLSEIKISDAKDFLLVKDHKFEITENEFQFFKTAKSFQELFIKNLLEKESPCAQQKNAKYKNYVNPIRIMIQKKEATIDQLREAHKYLDSPEGDFWKSNVLSTEKLREKLPQLLAKKNTIHLKTYVHGNAIIEKPVAGRQTENTIIKNAANWGNSN